MKWNERGGIHRDIQVPITSVIWPLIQNLATLRCLLCSPFRDEENFCSFFLKELAVKFNILQF